MYPLSSRTFLFSFLTILLTSIPIFALGVEGDFAENPEACNSLFGLPEGTIRMDADKGVMNPEVCGAYLFLISRYSPGPRSSVGLSNPRVEGITNLNPDFAVALAKMLTAAPSLGIISAYRTPAGQGSKNPQSNHIYGCAVDLGYSQSICSQVQCQWVLRNAPSFGIQIRMKYSPEWNHVEPIAKDACRSNGPGVGDPVATPPSSPITDYVRQLLGGGQGTQQNCTLPDGNVVPCSVIANQGTQQQQPTVTPIQNSPQGGGSTQQTQQSSSGTSADLSGQSQASGRNSTENSSPLETQSISDSIREAFSQATTSGATSSTRKLSAFEQISVFAQGTTSVNTPAAITAPPLVLIVGEDGAVSIQSTPAEDVSTATQDNTSVITPTSQQTFTSQELGNPIFAEPTAPAQTTFGPYQSILASMQNIVYNMLAYLRPFGRPVDYSHTYEQSDWAE